MIKILSFNTTGKLINLVFQGDEKVIYRETIEEKNKHSELLILSIEKILKKFKLEYKNLDAISIINGPGNFMGLRAGVSVAKAIKISTQIPIITIKLFELLDNKKNDSIIAIKANLNNYYIYNTKTKEQKVATYSELEKLVNIKIITNNEFLSKLPNAKKIDFDFDVWTKLIYKKYQKKDFKKNIEPLYIRPPKITKRKTKK